MGPIRGLLLSFCPWWLRLYWLRKDSHNDNHVIVWWYYIYTPHFLEWDGKRKKRRLSDCIPRNLSVNIAIGQSFRGGTLAAILASCFAVPPHGRSISCSPDSGFLLPLGGEGDEPLWRIGRGTRVPLQGAVDVVPWLSAIVGCHCIGGRWRPTLGAWTWCHCWVPLQGTFVVCYGWGGIFSLHW